MNAPSWSPDGATVLASARSLRDGPSNMVFAVDVVAGTSRNVGGKWGFVGDLEWMPDGRSFVMSGVDFTASTPQLWQITFPTGQRRRITNDLNTYIGVSLGADGKSITTIQTETNANLWILTTGESAEARQVTSGRGRADALQGLSWTGDGRLVFSSAPSGLPGIWIVNADGTGQRQLTHDPAPAIGPAATRDGRFVVYQQFRENGMYLWRMGTDGVTRSNSRTAAQSSSLSCLQTAVPSTFSRLSRVKRARTRCRSTVESNHQSATCRSGRCQSPRTERCCWGYRGMKNGAAPPWRSCPLTAASPGCCEMSRSSARCLAGLLMAA